MAITYSCPERDFSSSSPGLCPVHKVPLELAEEGELGTNTAERYTSPAPGCAVSSGMPGVYPEMQFEEIRN